jgi:hypothetical protein
MAQTSYTIFRAYPTARLPDLTSGGQEVEDVWVPLGVGEGSTPAQAARQFFAQADEHLHPKGGEHYLAVPTGNIHSLPASVETQTRLTFG